MQSIIETFHLDWGLFIAQVLNFFVVVVVLWYFALRPLNHKMNNRASTIEKSLKEAEQIAKNLTSSEEEKKKILVEARKEARQIVEDSGKKAEEERQVVLDRASDESAKIISEAKKSLEVEREKIMSDVKKEVAEIVALVSEKVLGKTINADIDSSLVEKTLVEIKNEKRN